MDYAERLQQTKSAYAFDVWRQRFDDGLEQYTEENCQKTQGVFDELLRELEQLGESASEERKIAAFERAVLALNELNDELGGSLIETGEREELCEMFNVITSAAGLDPTRYGDGEGLASEWRDW